MFHRKLVTYLLLVLYGVPTALGPYWHRHGHSPLSQHSCADCVPSAGQPTASSHAEHACSCPEHATNRAQARAAIVAEVRGSLNTLSVASGDDTDSHSNCAICHFYAIPFILIAQLTALDRAEQIDQLNNVTSVAVVARAPQTLARGPPL